MSETPHETSKIPLLFMVVISVMLIISVMALYQAFEDYKAGSLNIVSIMLGISAIAISSYMLIQMRGKPLRLGFEIPKVFTTIQCTNCGFKNVREFQKGDYILKEAEPCPKCSNIMFVSSIYREAEESEGQI